MNEHQVREHVRKLRRFYTDAMIYGVVNLGLILIWAISGGGYFWPIWVIIGWGIGLGIHAFSLGLVPQITTVMPFMTSEWEDQEVQRLMKNGYKHKDKEEKKEILKAVAKAEKIAEKVISASKKQSVKKKTPKVAKESKVD